MLLSTMFVNLAIFAICVVHISIQLIMLYRLFFRRYSCFDKYNNTTIGSNLFRRSPSRYSGYGSYERSQTGQFEVFEEIRYIPICLMNKTVALTLKMTLTRKKVKVEILERIFLRLEFTSSHLGCIYLQFPLIIPTLIPA